MGIAENENNPLQGEDLISFLKEHFRENQEDLLLSQFKNSDPLFLIDIYKNEIFRELRTNTTVNIYERAYLRLLIDFDYIKVKRVEEKVDVSGLLYCLLSKGLFCISADFVTSLTREEIDPLRCDLTLFSFLNERRDDGNVRYLIKSIFDT